MNKVKYAVIGFISLGLLLSACNVSEKSYTKDYEEIFYDIKEIEVDGRFLEVSYEGREGETEVKMNAYLEAFESNGLDIKFRKSGSKLKIEVVGDATIIGWNFGNSINGFISLTGPDNIKLNISNTSGKIDVMHVHHERINLKVNSGSIKLSDVEVDNIHLEASSGSIEGEGLYGNILAKVNSGQIRLSDLVGNIDAKGSSGRLFLGNIEGKVDAKVNSGSIKLESVKELGDLSVSSGSIKADNSGLGPDTQLHANSGSVQIQTFSNLDDFNFDLNASSGSVKVGDKESGKKVKIDNDAIHTISGRVSSGSIRINN
jgi:lia operon protein LiaG